MANHNPPIQNLEKGRNKPRLGKKEVTIQLHPQEKTKLEEIAKELGYTHGNKGSLTGLLSQIAQDKLMIVETPKTHIFSTHYSSPLSSNLPDHPDKTLDESFCSPEQADNSECEYSVN